MKNIGVRHDENVKKIFGRGCKLDFGDFWSCLDPICFILFCPHPTLKYPLHAPAEKCSYFSKYVLGSKVFDYDCVTLYQTNQTGFIYILRGHTLYGKKVSLSDIFITLILAS